MKEQKLKDGIWVDEDGYFNKELGEGNVVRAETFAKLQEKIDKAGKAPKVKIEISCRMPGRYGDESKPPKVAIITGIHADNGNLLVKVEGEKGVEQISKYDSRKLYRPLDAVELQKLAALQQAVKQAEKALGAYTKSIEIDGYALAEAAIKKALTEKASA